jgi:hypothetical protein
MNATMQQMLAEINEKDRQRFERWYSRELGHNVEPASLAKLRKGDTYEEFALAITWKAWQAAILSIED